MSGFRGGMLRDPKATRAGLDVADELRRRDTAGKRPGVALRTFHGNDALTLNDGAVAYDGAGGHVLSTPDANDVGGDLSVMIRISNRGGGNLSVAPFRTSQKLNGGTAAVTIAAGGAGLLFSDGDGWKLVQ